MTKPEIEYDIAIEGASYQIRIDWGNAPGWRTEHAEKLATAERISLLPKHTGLPVVTIARPGLKDVFSRVVGKIGAAGIEQQRLYCVQCGDVRVWVYPGGSVELAEEPSFL